MRKAPILILLTMCSIFMFFFNSCGQNSTDTRLKNKSLPKDITLNPNTKKIIDSVFIYRNRIQKLQSVQLFELKNGILVSGNRQYYVNDTLNQTTNEIFNSDGNSIESNTLLHFKKSRQVFERTLDKYGNIVLLKTTDDNKVNILEYQNSYKENKLVAVSKVSKKSGNTIEKNTFKYDNKGNLIEEWVANSFLNAKNIYQFNEANQLILHKHIRNGVLNDSVIYYYSKGRLLKKEWYQNTSARPMTNTYTYNVKGQVILETDEFTDRTEYKNFDSFSNWQVRETYTYGNITTLTTRLFLNY